MTNTDPAGRARELFVTDHHSHGCAEASLIALQEHFGLPEAGDGSAAEPRSSARRTRRMPPATAARAQARVAVTRRPTALRTSLLHGRRKTGRGDSLSALGAVCPQAPDLDATTLEEDQVRRPVPIQVPIEEPVSIVVLRMFRISAPPGRNDVGLPVRIQIAGRDPVPAAHGFR